MSRACAALVLPNDDVNSRQISKAQSSLDCAERYEKQTRSGHRSDRGEEGKKGALRGREGGEGVLYKCYFAYSYPMPQEISFYREFRLYDLW